MMPNTRPPSPTIDSSAPIGSSGRRSSSRDDGTTTAMAPKASRAMGTLMNSTDPHQKCSSRIPLMSGPMAPPAPAKPAHTAMALPRSWGGKTTVRMDSVAGMISAAPSPITARRAMSCIGSPAWLATTAATANTPSPVSRARLRPKRSPRAPAKSRKPANTRP